MLLIRSTAVSTYLLLLMSLLSCSAAADVLEKEYFNHYFVTPEDGKSLRQSLNDASPIVRNGQTFYGKTEWSVLPNFRYKDYGSLCVVKEVEVQLNIKFILPKLHYTETPPDALIVKFEQFYNALYLHEQGHKALGVRAANVIEAELKSLTPYGNCNELKSGVQTKIQQILEEYKALNRQYDIDTNHGMTQGAVIKDVIISS